MPTDTTPTIPQLIDLRLVRDMAVLAQTVKAHPNYDPVILVPEGYTVQPLKETPLREETEQLVKLDDTASFIAYLNTFKEDHTRIFATTNDAGARFIAVMDYHFAPKEGDAGARNYCKHQVAFEPAYCSEFDAWKRMNGKRVAQGEFCDFLRRWGFLVANYDAADLAEYVTNLEFRTNGQFKNKIERVKGGRALIWTETVEGGSVRNGVEVPIIERLELMIPIFVGGPAYPLGCNLLYKVGETSLGITVELERENLVIRAAVAQLVEDVAKGTGIQPFIGALK